MPYTWWFYTQCGEFTGTGEFPAQRTSYAENVSIWWRYHDSVWWLGFCMIKGVSAGIWLLHTAHSRARYLSVHHDDVIRWKHFPRYWPFVRAIHRWIPAQRPETRSFDVFFDIRLNKRLSKQSWGWWFDTPWVIVHTSDLMMIIRQSIYILSIITTEMGKLKTYSPTYCIMDNGQNMLNLTHILDKIYRTGIL